MGGKKFELMLEIGHKSQPLKSKLSNGYTHKWTVFVRGANNTKIEHCIQRVVFQLHESFPEPSREITSAPYQVKETGYAGFEIPIEVYFKSRDKIKPNHLVFVHDLNLLTNKPHSASKVEKVTFHNPHKEFEKSLIKSGAEIISITKDKKERSDSPPAKRQKSSSLIPSKDMCMQQNQSLSHGNNTNSHSPAPQTQHHQNHGRNSQQSHHSHANNGGNSSGNSLFGSNHTSHQNSRHSIHDSRHQVSSTKASSHASSLPKTKSSSREFMDVFGAPLVYNNSKSHKSSSGKDSSDNHKDVTFTTNDRSPLPPSSQQKSPQPTTTQSHSNHSHYHKSSHSHNSHHHHNQKHTHKPQADTQPTSQQAPQKLPQKLPQPLITQTDPFSVIQNKIASLTDCDRLQKIVDIIEESGEWFNLTPNKFEFDLKRLDKKTLNRIEKCLHL